MKSAVMGCLVLGDFYIIYKREGISCCKCTRSSTVDNPGDVFTVTSLIWNYNHTWRSAQTLNSNEFVTNGVM